MGFSTGMASCIRRLVKRFFFYSKYVSDLYVDKRLDTDDPEHINWLYNIALKRAKEFKIEGVTWSLTQGVVKNIIPAIASTNAIIAGTHVASPAQLYSFLLYR